jgi:hypothetical protein
MFDCIDGDFNSGRVRIATTPSGDFKKIVLPRGFLRRAHYYAEDIKAVQIEASREQYLTACTIGVGTDGAVVDSRKLFITVLVAFVDGKQATVRGKPDNLIPLIEIGLIGRSIPFSIEPTLFGAIQ